MTKLARITCILGITLASGAAAFAGPFDRSHALCEADKNADDILQCGVLQPHVTKTYRMRDFLEVYPLSTFSEILELNGWEEDEVGLDTIVPKGKKFVIDRFN